MKKMIKAFCIFILVTLLLASCDMAEPIQPTNAMEAPTKQEKPSVNETEAPTKEQKPEIEVNPLILDDYDDYLLFRKGELEVQEAYYVWYGNNPNVLIDIRTLLDLPELLENFTEEIIIQTDDSVIYCVYSSSENGRKTLEYLVDVIYHPDSVVNDTSHYPIFDTLKANTKNEKYFSVCKNESILKYSQDNGFFKFCNLNSGQYNITVMFYSIENTIGYTPEQIEEKCGKLVASFFSKNDEEFSRGVETVTKAIGALSRAESSFS